VYVQSRQAMISWNCVLEDMDSGAGVWAIQHSLVRDPMESNAFRDSLRAFGGNFRETTP
jgi:hypothetical protein